MNGVKRTLVAVAADCWCWAFQARHWRREVIKATDDNRWSPRLRPRLLGRESRVEEPRRFSPRAHVTADSSNWSKNVVLQPGERTSKVFKKRGIYEFVCSFHGGMTGSGPPSPPVGSLPNQPSSAAISLFFVRN